MNDIEINSLDWQKMNGLIPAIIQNAENGNVLMLGYMNHEALLASATTGQLTLFSRSRNRVSRKGDSSGNTMAIQSMSVDCDNDSLLIQVLPKGPSCHKGHTTCYQPETLTTIGYFAQFIDHINHQIGIHDEHSRAVQLINNGVNCCAQKMGESAIATIIEATQSNKEDLVKQGIELLFYLVVLFAACDLSFYELAQTINQETPS